MEKEKAGAAVSSVCPREGSIWLQSPIGQTLVMRTTCKTWGCRGCRDRLQALFRARVEIGCSTLGRCAFITLTYKAGVKARMGVEYVKEDWRTFLRKSDLRRYRWFRIMELTKRATPHHHLVLGPIEGRIRCYGRDFDIRVFDRGFDRCACLSHTLARQWLDVTKDSRIVHAVPVIGASGAGSYMAKYLLKGFGEERHLQALGMQRRWSSGRGWPGSGKLCLSQTLRGGWRRVEWRAGHVPEEKIGGPKYLLERSGSDIAVALAEKRRKRGLVNYIVKKVRVA